MAYYRGGRGANVTPTVDWDDVFRRQPPNLRRPILFVSVFFLLWILFSIAPRLYTDYRWFEEVGYASVFTTELTARVAIFFGAASNWTNSGTILLPATILTRPILGILTSIFPTSHVSNETLYIINMGFSRMAVSKVAVPEATSARSAALMQS